MLIQWRQRRSRSESADRGIFWWSRVSVGNGAAPPVVPPAVGQTGGGKRKKRWYTFENGIRVHSYDEAQARQIANWQPDGPAPVETPRRPVEPKRVKPAPVVARQVVEAPTAPPQAVADASFDRAVEDERRKREAKRKREEQELRDLIMLVLMAAEA